MISVLIIVTILIIIFIWFKNRATDAEKIKQETIKKEKELHTEVNQIKRDTVFDASSIINPRNILTPIDFYKVDYSRFKI